MIHLQPNQYDGVCLNCGKKLKSAVAVKNSAFYQLTIPLCAECLQQCADVLKGFDVSETEERKEV